MDIDSSPPQPRVLSIKEAARACGISRATLYRLINDRKLATVKIASRRLIRPEAIEALLSAGETK
jgi:excisionase family DNA binding protein